jgi:RNA polymerase sigma-70 factor (ECF subfamily)
VIAAQETYGRALAAHMTDRAAQDQVHLAQQGDMVALAALYDQHYPLIFGYLRARLGDRHAVEDLTGEVFQRMLAALPAYRAHGLPFRAWLFRIAHNLLVDHYRQAGRTVPVEWLETGRAADPSGDPAAVIERTLTLEQTLRALVGLEDLQRDVVTLRFLSGLSLRETALALGKSEDAVKALQRRGLAALRRALDELNT